MNNIGFFEILMQVNINKEMKKAQKLVGSLWNKQMLTNML